MKKTIKANDIIMFVVTTVIAIVFAFPIYFNIMSAFKSNGEIMRDAIAFPKGFYLDSFKYLLTETQYPAAMLNSAILTFVSIVFMVLVIPMAAYAIERTNSKWTNSIFTYFYSG